MTAASARAVQRAGDLRAPRGAGRGCPSRSRCPLLCPNSCLKTGAGGSDAGPAAGAPGDGHLWAAPPPGSTRVMEASGTRGWRKEQVR